MFHRVLRRWNHYELLGLPYDASNLQVKQSFYKLAKKYHPDATNGQTSDKFKEIAEAYKVLSDPELRQIYDRKIESGEVSSRRPEGSSEEGKPTEEEKVSPSASPYNQTYASIFEAERRSKLREHRMNQGIHLNDPMYKKLIVDTARDASFTSFLILSVAAIFISTLMWGRVSSSDRALSDAITRELALIRVEKLEESNRKHH